MSGSKGSKSKRVRDKTLLPPGPRADEELAQKIQQQEFAGSSSYQVASGASYQTSYAAGGTVGAGYQQVPDSSVVGALRGSLDGGRGATHGTTVFLGHEERMMDCYSLGRGIKLFACVDGLFLFMNCFIVSWLVIMLWGPAAGFQAGRQYDKKWIFVYRVYYYCRLLADGIMILIGAWWFVLSLMVDIFVLRYIMTFTRLLEGCSEEELMQLRRPESVWNRSARPYFAVF